MLILEGLRWDPVALKAPEADHDLRLETGGNVVCCGIPSLKCLNLTVKNADLCYPLDKTKTRLS